jgi:hypothetical protein
LRRVKRYSGLGEGKSKRVQKHSREGKIEEVQGDSKKVCGKERDEEGEWKERKQ